jgi:CRISPR-associated protein Cas2
MTDRSLYIAAYDVAHERRRRACLALARGYATGGQKSVYECFLSPGEKTALLHAISLIQDEAEDRFLLLRLDPRAAVFTLGIAEVPVDPQHFYIG